MSFSSEVKEELSRFIPEARHCCIAESAAIISILGKVNQTPKKQLQLELVLDYPAIARKCFTLLKKTYNIVSDISIVQPNVSAKKRYYSLKINQDGEVRKVLEGMKLVDRDYSVRDALMVKDNMIIKNTCCKRAFIRGAFLASGSVSNPEKAYHFEIIFFNEENAILLRDLMRSLGLDAKIVQRKKSYVVYLKESEQIVEVLGSMEAVSALMAFENTRIIKCVRNDVNRKVNCETANLNKTVSAAYKQVKDIEFIRQSIGLERLSDALREIAYARLEHPQATLKELGEILSPPVSKSGVNHRLRKLSEIAENIENLSAL
ncbi:MAG: DNA-binding protein WhiA [Johnsonella sp.]|nr:DNA-binding protein WhiA [Johnsonella sp.]